jgi:hypothetical protein
MAAAALEGDETFEADPETEKRSPPQPCGLMKDRSGFRLLTHRLK